MLAPMSKTNIFDYLVWQRGGDVLSAMRKSKRHDQDLNSGSRLHLLLQISLRLERLLAQEYYEGALCVTFVCCLMAYPPSGVI